MQWLFVAPLSETMEHNATVMVSVVHDMIPCTVPFQVMVLLEGDLHMASPASELMVAMQGQYTTPLLKHAR